MVTNLNLRHLLPTNKLSHSHQENFDIFDTMYIGIDFGTSTTVVTSAYLEKETLNLKTKTIWLDQKMPDGSIVTSEIVPTILAWYNDKLLVGQGAFALKYELKKGVNVWYSFKMELGIDLGPIYYNSELGQKSEIKILKPSDAVSTFFQYLKFQIEKYILKYNLPKNIKYAVSIPAAFEANQRRELVNAIEQNGMSVNKQSLIDEPNAAFLSFLHSQSDSFESIIVPSSGNINVLVFDFGAGTCDISILEIGKDSRGYFSKNLSISKFDKLGGDDLDRFIAAEVLYKQLLEDNKKTNEDFKTPVKKRIITNLFKISEQLKIKACDIIGLQMSNYILPDICVSSENISSQLELEIETRQGVLRLREPKLSFVQFKKIMDKFTNTKNLNPFKSQYFDDEFISIYKPIYSALMKANLSKDDIDYVLLIGGSSKNPFIQTSLKTFFDQSNLIIPQNLQTHVSIGAAIHSLLYNGFNFNVIKPITSEPILAITADKTPKILLRASTPIPCDLIIIDDLVTVYDGQPAIEIPICLGNQDKILYNVKIISNNLNGFRKDTSIRLEIEITSDKLLLIRASADNQSVLVEPINPFANKELSTEKRIIFEAEKEANIAAANNGGKPTRDSLKRLSSAYEEVGEHLRAAETLELLYELYPDNYLLNNIGVFYSNAGLKEKALHYFELAYKHSKSSITAFNLALNLKLHDKKNAKMLFQESMSLDPNMAHSIFEFGQILYEENDQSYKMHIEKAFNIWKNKFESNSLPKDEYSWFATAADFLGLNDYAKLVRNSRPTTKSGKFFNPDNLSKTISDNNLSKI